MINTNTHSEPNRFSEGHPQDEDIDRKIGRIFENINRVSECLESLRIPSLIGLLYSEASAETSDSGVMSR